MPRSALEVRGDIRLGSAGRYLAAAGEENLRLLRGSSAPDGTPTAGDGFSVNRVGTGDYKITFTTPFSGAPSVTATSYNYLEATVCSIIQPDANLVTIEVRKASGDPINWGFNFCIIGPR